jgi:hypothetical protein
MAKDILTIIDEKIAKADRIPEHDIEGLHNALEELKEKGKALASGDFIDCVFPAENGKTEHWLGLWMWIDPATCDDRDIYCSSALVRDEGNQGFYSYLGMLSPDERLLDAAIKIRHGEWRCRYDLGLAANQHTDETYGGFQYLYVWCPQVDTDKYDGLCVITNRYGAGRWIENADGSLKQIEGTAQFQLPGSPAAIKAFLRKEYILALSSKASCPF